MTINSEEILLLPLEFTMKQEGIDHEYLSEHIKALIEGKKHTFHGAVIDDLNAKAKGIEIAPKIMGAYAPDKIDIDAHLLKPVSPEELEVNKELARLVVERNKAKLHESSPAILVDGVNVESEKQTDSPGAGDD